MNAKSNTYSYEEAQITHQEMLENMLENLNATKMNNVPTKENSIQNCVYAIQEEMINAEDLCNQILKHEDNREWYSSDVSWLESDVEIIVKEAYSFQLDNFEKVLWFVGNKFPYIDQVAVGCKVLLAEMEKIQTLNQTELNMFIIIVNKSLNGVFKSTEGSLLIDIFNELNTRIQALKYTTIQNCVKAVQSEDVTKTEEECNQILKKENNRAWVSGRDYYKEDVVEIVKRAYSGKEENFDIVLKFIREKFPYNSQDLLAYRTLLEEITANTHLNVKTLSKMLANVKSSVEFAPLPLSNSSKTEYEMLKINLLKLLEIKEEESFEIFTKAIQTGTFTAEENKLWEQLYGRENDSPSECISCDYVDKLIVLTFDADLSNFNTVVKVINKLYFPNQKVESYYILLKEIEKLQDVQETILKTLANKIGEIEASELFEDFRNKLMILKNKLNSLPDETHDNIKDIQTCLGEVKNKDLAQAKIQCHKILLSMHIEKSNEIYPEKDYIVYIVTTTYDNNLYNVEYVLKFIDIFPYTEQRLEGYKILLSGIKKQARHALYFSALDQLKEKIKAEMHAEHYQYVDLENKEQFEKLRKHMKELIGRFIQLKQKYTNAKQSLKHVKETKIIVDNIRIQIFTYYDTPPYFMDYSVENALKEIGKEARKCIKDFKDFVLPKGWTSATGDGQINVWVFNDPDIFNHRAGFTRLDGIYLYRTKRSEGLIQQFRHQFMHILFAGGFGKINFVANIPQWFHEGLAELAGYGQCNSKHLSLVKNYIKDSTFGKMCNAFIEMIHMTNEEQKKYSGDYSLNRFLPYFALSYLRMQHPEFLQEMIRGMHENGWEAQSTFQSNMPTYSVKENLSNFFYREKNNFFNWMEDSSQNFSFCYSNQPNRKYTLANTYGISRVRRDYETSSFVHTDGKFSWQNLMNAFSKKDPQLIDQEIQFYHATLKKLIENLNLLPFKEHMEQQQPFVIIVLRFLDEIHSRTDEISIAYYSYYANLFLKLVFEDITIPLYQRASLERENAASLMSKIQSEFEDFLIKAFSKDLPPDRRAFLRWYSVRCQNVDFCTAKSLATTAKMLDNLSGKSEDIELVP